MDAVNTVLALLIGAVAVVGGTVAVRVIRAELSHQRTQKKAWDEKERAELAALDPAPGPEAPSGVAACLGEAATFQAPAQQGRPVVVTAVVVDQASKAEAGVTR